MDPVPMVLPNPNPLWYVLVPRQRCFLQGAPESPRIRHFYFETLVTSRSAGHGSAAWWSFAPEEKSSFPECAPLSIRRCRALCGKVIRVANRGQWKSLHCITSEWLSGHLGTLVGRWTLQCTEGGIICRHTLTMLGWAHKGLSGHIRGT